MIIALMVYFFIMRNKTVKIEKHLMDSLRKRLASSESLNPYTSPNKTMSLISFDRISPDKVVPMPYPVTEYMD